MSTQPYSKREMWLTHCEHELARAEAKARAEQGRVYEVTRPVAGEPMTTLWTEELVRYFLQRNRYHNPEMWLRWAGEGNGTQTSFGWVRERKAQGVDNGNP